MACSLNRKNLQTQNTRKSSANSLDIDTADRPIGDTPFGDQANKENVNKEARSVNDSGLDKNGRWVEVEKSFLLKVVPNIAQSLSYALPISPAGVESFRRAVLRKLDGCDDIVRVYIKGSDDKNNEGV